MVKSKNIFMNFFLLIVVVMIIILTMTGCVKVSSITSCPSSDPSPMSCSILKINYLNESYPYMTLLSEVANECSEDISCLHVQAIYHDTLGKEVGRSDIYLGDISAGDRMKFNLDVKTNNPQTKSCTAEIIEGAFK